MLTKRFKMKFLFVFTMAPLLIVDSASAQLLPFTQFDLDQINRSQNIRDPEAEPPSLQCGESSLDPSDNSKAFFIGDSITVGMADSGLLEKAKEKGFVVGTNPQKLPAQIANGTPRRKGPSIEAIESAQSTNIQPYLAEHASDYADAGTIVVGLGTNRGVNTAQETMISSTTQFVDVLRSNNPTARIVWVNVYRGDGQEGNINAAIAEAGERKNFTVLDFSSVARANPDTYKLSDAVHHTTSGNQAKADWIIDQISANTAAPGGTEQSCAGITGDKDVDLINALKNSGLTIAQAVGILANVYHESGNVPNRQECVYSVEDGLRKGIPANFMGPDGGISSENQRRAAQILLDGNHCTTFQGRRIKTTANGYGWGIVQWTPARKMIDVSFDAGVPYKIIDTLQYQTDFLISQLQGIGVGLLIQYEVNAGTAEAVRNRGFVNTTTAEDAAEYFAINYERCAACKAGNKEITDRRAEAAELFVKYRSL